MNAKQHTAGPDHVPDAAATVVIAVHLFVWRAMPNGVLCCLPFTFYLQADMWSVGVVMNDLFDFKPVQPFPGDELFWRKVSLGSLRQVAPGTTYLQALHRCALYSWQ